MGTAPPLAERLTDEGNGPVLLFLHHFGGSRRSWQGVIGRLSGRYRCIAPDLPGFGSAAGHSGPFTSSASAEWVVDLLRRLGVRDYCLVGHSMGGKMAMAVAATNPAGLRRLVLLAPSPPTPEPIPESDRAHLLASWGNRDAMAAVIDKITVRPLSRYDRDQQLADMLATSRPAWEAWLNYGSREDISASLGRINIPIDLVSGQGDETIPVEVLRRTLLERAPSATLETIRGAGHLLPIEARDEVASIIQRSGEEPAWRRAGAATTVGVALSASP